MRFAWLREKTADPTSAEQSGISRFILVAYNVVWWVPIVLPFPGVIDYGTGFIAFAAITFLRLVINLYRNNVLTLDQAESFPLRQP
jgi:hypothetical protein